MQNDTRWTIIQWNTRHWCACIHCSLKCQFSCEDGYRIFKEYDYILVYSNYIKYTSLWSAFFSATSYLSCKTMSFFRFIINAILDIHGGLLRFRWCSDQKSLGKNCGLYNKIYTNVFCILAQLSSFYKIHLYYQLFFVFHMAHFIAKWNGLKPWPSWCPLLHKRLNFKKKIEILNKNMLGARCLRCLQSLVSTFIYHMAHENLKV